MVRISEAKDSSCSRGKPQYTSLQIKSAEINGYRPYVVQPGYSRYTGYWKQNKADGFGARHNFDGLVYDGQWKDGLRHGQGALRRLMPDKTYNRIYIGQWAYNSKCGEGKQYFKNGVYYGMWKANQRSGLGIMWYNDGSQYVGEWANDRWHGAGVLFQTNGNRYEGFFENGKKHGEGIFFHLHTGQVQKGMWQYDVCTVSMMFDCFRNQMDQPTASPIARSGLADPDHIVSQLFREYFPEIEDDFIDLSGRPCGEIAREMRSSLDEDGKPIDLLHEEV